jgi:hypothetical protein
MTGSHPGEAPDTGRLGDDLREQSTLIPVGPPPVDAVLRRGRAIRRRRRLAAGTVAAAVLALASTVALLAPFDTGTVTVTATPGGAPQEVPPDTPLDIGHDMRVTLLSGDPPRYLVRSEWFRPTGDDTALHEAGTLGAVPMMADAGPTVYGEWRDSAEIPDIRVTVGDRTWRPTLLRLPGDPGWGVYFLHLGEVPPDTPVTATHYAPDGSVRHRVPATFAPGGPPVIHRD